MSIRIWLLALLTLSLAACIEDSSSDGERYDVGYSDGYAEGYNTECKIRATLIEGDWDNQFYTQGYNEGRYAGVRACWEKDR